MDGLEEKSIPWIFGYCWPPISVLRTLWIFPWFVRMHGHHLHCCLLDEVVPPSLPLHLWPESVKKLLCLQACVIRSLYHMYEPSAARIAENPAIPESTSSTLKTYKCLLFWCRKIIGNRQEPMWEFNCKFEKQSPRLKSKCMGGLQPPIQYKDVHNNPDQDCCLLQVTTLNFIFIPIVMGMIFTLFTINVSTDSAASSSETGVPRLSCPWWSETAQWTECASHPEPSTQRSTFWLAASSVSVFPEHRYCFLSPRAALS